MHGKKEECIDGFGGKSERNHWEDLEVDWRIRLKCVIDKYDGGIWTPPAQIRGQLMGSC
jgi:hypothetical protein